MALIECWECGHQVSTNADACSWCGAKVQRRGWRSWVAGIVVLAGVTVLVMFLSEGGLRLGRAPQTTSAAQAPASPAAPPAPTPEQREAQAAQERARLGLIWTYVEEEDTMSKKPVRLAIIETINELEFGFPYQGAQRGRLFLRVHPRYGRDVFLVIRRGQFLCRPDDCRVMVRFDDSPGQRFNAAEPANFDSTTLFIRDYDKFLGGLSKAKKLYIEVVFYQEGSRTFEFDVSGLKWQP